MTEERRQELQSIVAEVVRSRFPGTEFPAIRLRPERDHDGDPVLLVRIYFRPDPDRVPRVFGGVNDGASTRAPKGSDHRDSLDLACRDSARTSTSFEAGLVASLRSLKMTLPAPTALSGPSTGVSAPQGVCPS